MWGYCKKNKGRISAESPQSIHYLNNFNSPEFAAPSNQAVVGLTVILTNTVVIKQKQLHCRLALLDVTNCFHSAPNEFAGMQ